MKEPHNRRQPQQHHHGPHDCPRAQIGMPLDRHERALGAEARLRQPVVADLSVPAATETELAVWDASLADGLEQDENFASWR